MRFQRLALMNSCSGLEPVMADGAWLSPFKNKHRARKTMLHTLANIQQFDYLL